MSIKKQTNLTCKKISIIIPYAYRITNITMVLQALSKQTLPFNEFEIIIGSLEYSEDLIKLINHSFETLPITTIMVREKWNTARARNLALQQASGEAILLLDADILIPPRFLEELYEEYRESTKNHLFLCQVKNYDEWDENETHEHPYSFYEENYLSQDPNNIDLPQDVRWETEITIPWAMCWTGLVFFPREKYLEKELFFEQNFKGRGAEDIEWGFRVAQSGMSTILSKKCWGIHLPHQREAETNHQHEAKNFRTFLNKWQFLDVEVVTKFGDFKGNSKFKNIKKELLSFHPEALNLFSIVEIEDLIVIGCIFKEKFIQNNHRLPITLTNKDCHTKKDLLGISLPYKDKHFSKAYMSKDILELPATIQTMVLDEATRVAQEVIQ